VAEKEGSERGVRRCFHLMGCVSYFSDNSLLFHFLIAQGVELGGTSLQLGPFKIAKKCESQPRAMQLNFPPTRTNSANFGLSFKCAPGWIHETARINSMQPDVSQPIHAQNLLKSTETDFAAGGISLFDSPLGCAAQLFQFPKSAPLISSPIP